MEMELAAATTSYRDLIEAQKDLFQNQIETLQQIVAAQCKLTGVNPLSQEMAAGALSIKIGKRPRDLLNPKAVKYMQSLFSIKDAISKRETREISAQFGVTATQVRDFYMGQRSRVRKFSRLSREKSNRSPACDATHGDIASTSDPNMPAKPVPINIVDPTDINEEPSCSKMPDVLSGMEELEIHFIENIFSSMRKEESFSGQVKLLKWILCMENPSVLNWFLSEGGLMILATWLSEAAKEEQSSFIRVVLKVLHYLPMLKALPVHMSAVLQSVNKLRFYRTSDISHRARILLAKWSNMFGKKLSLKNGNESKSASELEDEMLLKQSINEVMGNESWDLKDDNTEEALRFLVDNPDNHRKLDAQPLKMLTAPGDESNKRRGVLSSNMRERRKVQMVEHPGQKLAVRSPQVARTTPTTQSRPLSADDIQKAKMRAQFMQSKHGKTMMCPDEKATPESQNRSTTSHATSLPSVSKSSYVQTELLEEEMKLEKATPESQNRSTTSHATSLPSVSKSSYVQTEFLEEEMKLDNAVPKLAKPQETSLDLKEPPWKKFKRVQIPWRTPPEVEILEEWCVGGGADSKEVDVQKNRIRRDKETIYRSIHEIPPDPKEPWDRKMDPDDTLTPEIPIEQMPDVEPLETPSVSHNVSNEIVPSVASTSSDNMPQPDLELLAELLKNPQLVFALTSGQAGNLSSDATVKLLDMIKANGVSSLGSLAGNGDSMVEVSLPSPTPLSESPTPLSEAVPNGLRPDFSRNPFSRQQASVNGNVSYHGTVVPARTLTQTQIPSTTILPPVTSIKLQEQWQTPVINTQMHPQNMQPNSWNTQHLTTEMMLNSNTVPNSNRAPPNVVGAYNVNPSPVSILMPPSRTPQSNFLHEPIASNSFRARQGFETNSLYQNNRTANGYHAAYAGGRNNLVSRPGLESWSPDDSPSRHHEYLPGRQYHDPNVDLRGMQQNQGGAAGSKRWREHR